MPILPLDRMTQIVPERSGRKETDIKRTRGSERSGFQKALKEPSRKKDEDKEPSPPGEALYASMRNQSEYLLSKNSDALEGISASEKSINAKGSAYDRLHPEIAALFETMAGEMILIDATAEKHALISLTSPAFSKSVFFGTKVMISEFSTSPKTFNIQLFGPQAAAQVFQANAADFYRQFQTKSFDFDINRLEWSHDEEILEKFSFKQPIESSEESTS